MCVLHDLHELIQTDGLLTESVVDLLDEGYGTDNVRALVIRQPLERWGFLFGSCSITVLESPTVILTPPL